MENQFTKVMSGRTDEELIKIVTIERGSYNPTAMEAADSEIEKRNIDTSEFEKIKVKSTITNKQKVDKNVVSSEIRFVNFLIDLIVRIFLMFLISFIGSLFIQPTEQGLVILSYVLIFGIFIGYYTFMEIKFQKTVGKFVTKTKVVRINGEKPENGDIITRTFCRLIPFDSLSFLFVKNGFHDSLSKTKVVKDTA